MLLYNITLILEETAAAEWLEWAQETYIPQAMATGLFVSHRLLKVVDSPNEGITYCLQYVVEHPENYQAYQQVYAPELEESLHKKFENRYVSYRSLMEFIGA